jgi:peptide/nickel transport system substrate-binding protein
MTGHVRSAVATALLVGLFANGPALAQKAGGILKTSHFDSPASMSMLEEATGAANRPMMAVFNNLVMFKQDVPQASLQSIVPDLATAWSWNEDGTELTFPLRQGVRWHDGKPFTARDVICTWNLLTDNSTDKLRLNPRKSWYRNLQQVIANGDYEVTFRLKRSQPSFLALLASGWSPVYPCQVPAREMRSHPIGTGPFKFGTFKPNESIVVARNPLYWKQDRPYLDGIEYTIIPDVATRMLAFIAGKFDIASPFGVTIQLLKDVRSRVPEAVCEVTSTNISRDLIINRAAPPFDNPDLRRAMSLSLDRQAFIEILSAGQGDIGGAMLPPPEGIWGMPPEMLKTLPDVQKNRAEARQIMNGLGYGPDHRLPIKLSTRNMAAVRDPAVLLIDQLKEIYLDGDLEAIDTAQWYPKLMRKDYTVALGVTASGLDDPDQQFYENYVCGAERNDNGYCNPEVDKLVDRQSMESDLQKRHEMVWEIERKLAQDVARPIIFYPRSASCWQPYVKGLTIMVNSIYNGWRFEDVWLGR